MLPLAFHPIVRFSIPASWALFLFVQNPAFAETEMLLDHAVVQDEAGRLQPWTSYRKIVEGSMAYIKECPTVRTRHGQDPWFLVTSKLHPEGTFRRNQNNQGSNAYYAVKTLLRYLPYTGDRDAIAPVKQLLERVRLYHTPSDWAWPRVPRTQDDSPDGCYTDTWSEVDKICMVGIAYLRFADIVQEDAWRTAAVDIAKTVLPHIQAGDELHSPLPFRVNLQTGEVLDPYTASQVFPLRFFEELAKQASPEQATYIKARDTLLRWILAYPVRNSHWSGYYEDVKRDHDNLNQHIPLETARYLLEHFDDSKDYAELIPALIDWVRTRFGETKRHGATSIREQDGCFFEMSSHTARYASVLAGWWAVCEKNALLDEEGRAALREEARASLALCTYSTWSRHSQGERALNYVGVGYLDPWFSDSYFDFLPHLMDGVSLLGLETPLP